jgi:hypothetical protein
MTSFSTTSKMASNRRSSNGLKFADRDLRVAVGMAEVRI